MIHGAPGSPHAAGRAAAAPATTAAPTAGPSTAAASATRARASVLVRWASLHAATFLLAAFVTALAIAAWPEAMLAAYARWATVMQTAGARTFEELGSAAAVFRHVLTMNGATLAVFSFVAYVGQALLALPFAGAFYALVALLAPQAIGRPLETQDWLLVALEAAMLVAATALAAAIGGHRFGYGPGLGDLARFWRRGARRWWPEAVVPWRDVRGAWAGAAAWIAAGLAVVWLAAAALEAFGG